MNKKDSEFCLQVDNIRLAAYNDSSWFKFTAYIRICPDITDTMTDERKKEYVMKYMLDALKIAGGKL
jgi:hypothetical protein